MQDFIQKRGNILSNNISWLGSISRSHNSKIFERIHHASGTTISKLEVSLEHAGGTLPGSSYELNCLFDHLRIFITISSTTW